MDCTYISVGSEYDERLTGIVASQRPSRESSISAARAQLSERAIQHAEELLATTNLPARQVASKAGIRSVDWMNSAFRAKFGLTPGQYRAKSHADRWLQRLQHEDPPFGQILRVTGISSDAEFLARYQIFEPEMQARLHRFRLEYLTKSIDSCDASDVASILPPGLRQLPITALAMPSRAANACRRAGLSTVGAILTRHRDSLNVVPGLGKVSMRNLTTALWNAFEAYVSYLEGSCCEPVERTPGQNKRLIA